MVKSFVRHSTRRPGRGDWTPVWEIHVTDFNRDGMSDVLLSYPALGSRYLCITQPTPGSFAYYLGFWESGADVIVKHRW